MNREKHKILLVDNERGFIEPLKEFLEGINYQVLLAKNGEEGLETVRNEGPFSVILSDQRMHKMMGIDFLKIVMKESPITTRILVTAFQDSRTVSESINEAEVFAFISKPVDLDALKQIVSSAVKEYETKLQIRQRHKIIFVGQKAGLTNDTQIELSRKGYNLEFIRNRDEYMEMIKKNIPISAIIVNGLNQENGGLASLKHLKKTFPNAIRILLINRSHLAEMKGAINQIGVHKILNSPFDINELDEILRSSLQRHDQSLGVCRT